MMITTQRFSILYKDLCGQMTLKSTYQADYGTYSIEPLGADLILRFVLRTLHGEISNRTFKTR